MELPPKTVYMFCCDKCKTFQVIANKPHYSGAYDGWLCPATNNHYSTIKPIMYIAVPENVQSAINNLNERNTNESGYDPSKAFKLTEALGH